MTASPLTHFDAAGQAHMVDVSAKAETHRVARASGVIRMLPETLALIESGHAKKGDVLGVARIAAIQAAKRTSELIPLCHPLPITRVLVEFVIEAAYHRVRCTAQVETHGRTGVEMEALTAVQIGLLTIYDMCKAADRGMVMGEVRVLEKRGGKSGDWVAGRDSIRRLIIYTKVDTFLIQPLGGPMNDRARLFANGGSQAVRLPAEYRFEGDVVYVRRDPRTGDVILSSEPRSSWRDFMAFRQSLEPLPSNFLQDRAQRSEGRDPFAEWTE